MIDNNAKGQQDGKTYHEKDFIERIWDDLFSSVYNPPGDPAAKEQYDAGFKNAQK